MMQARIKIPRFLLETALEDLERPHPFACERVGFFSTKCSVGKELTLIHCVAYHPVSDAHYIVDHSVGVRIGSAAITTAMGRCATSGIGQIHVHSHGGGGGLSHPSNIDRRELPPLIRSLRNVSLNNASGWAVVSSDDAWSSVVLPQANALIEVAPVSIVGSPTIISERIDKPNKTIWRRRRRRKLSDERFERQSFLGPNSAQIFSRCDIGIVGVGGGGSHVAQQLSHLGFRQVILCDGDIITVTNLNRTVNATAADTRRKRYKTDIAERGYRSVLKDVRITNHRGRWENATEELMRCDIVVGSLDTFAGRRDLEAFCRRHLIPYVDVGMDVLKLGAFHEIVGQIILSMPGRPCMRCTGFLTDELLSAEAQQYGAAGGRPQVIWSNGVLCSAAVGVVVDLLTGWSGKQRESVYLNFRGSDLSLAEDARLAHVAHNNCQHYPLIQAGDPVWSAL
jgi:hypothetical protein